MDVVVTEYHAIECYFLSHKEIIRAKLVKLTRKKIKSTYYLLIPLYSFTSFCDCAKKWNG